MSSLSPFPTLTSDIIDYILKTLFYSLLQDFTRKGTLWKLSPGEWTRTLRVLYDKFFTLRLICKDINDRIISHGVLWMILPFGQMDQLDVARSLKNSKNCPLTVLLSDTRSRSNLDILLQSPLNKKRVQTLYIDLMASEWPGLSMIFQLHRLPALETLFLSSRGIEEEEDEDAIITGNAGGWGSAPLNVVNWPTAVGNSWTVGGGNGPIAAAPSQTNTVPILPPLVAKRHETQLSYKVGIANLAHLTARVLCIRDSAFGWQYFTPPFRLNTLQVHAGYDTEERTFPFNLEHLDHTIRSATALTELELWDVNAYGPRGLQPIKDSNIRYVAIRGPHGSMAAVSHYLRDCSPRILIIEIADEFPGSQHAAYTDIRSAAETFTDLHTISSIGIFVNTSEPLAFSYSVDLVLNATDGSVLSLRVPYSHSRALHAITRDCIPTSSRLSFDITPGDDYGEIVSTIFRRCIHHKSFATYHLRVDNVQIHSLLSALEPHRPRKPAGFIWFHGEGRYAAWARVVSEFPQWLPYIKMAVRSKQWNAEAVDQPNWVDWQNKPLFSPSVTVIHGHLTGMMKYIE